MLKMKRFSLKAWGLFIIATSCLILYLCFAPKPLSSAHHRPTPSPLPSDIKPQLKDLPEPGERIGIRGHGILLRKEAGLTSEVVRESEVGERFYTTGKTAMADDLSWIELELSPGQKAWISKGFIQRQREMPALQTLQTVNASPTPSPSTESFENPHLKLAAYWHKYPARVRQDISMKLAMQILKSSETVYTSEHAIALEACIDESSKAPDLQTLKIYELASTCALALHWQ